MNKESVAIIGAGIGGLATAARLARRGHQVDVYERLPEAGGRVHVIEDQGFRFDTGPSFVLMREFFDELFADCGETISDYLRLEILEQSYQIYYADGRVLNFYRDLDQTRDELERFSPGSAAAFDRFLAEAGEYYRSLTPFLYQCFSFKDLLRPRLWPLLPQLRPWQTFWQMARRYFRDEALCYAVSFEAMFLGASPFVAPGFYSLVTYADHMQKIYHPIGGMYAIARALERLGRRFGARFHYDAEVRSLASDQRRTTLTLADGRRCHADLAVVNADYQYAQQSLLGRGRPSGQPSCSTFLLYLGLKGRLPGLAHHNLFFSRDPRQNLRWIFGQGAAAEQVSFYVHIPTRTDPSLSPPGKDIVYLLVPVPHLGQGGGELDLERLRASILDRLGEILSCDIRPLIEVEHRFVPQDFVRRYNLYSGAAFGLGHTLWQSAFFRPGNQDRRYKNIYYVGASTQPGGGLPPVIAGSRIVADLITRKGQQG